MTSVFSVDWFSGNIPLWEKHLAQFTGKEAHALEIGSYEGRSATWLLENILTHAKSTMTCVDNFTQKERVTKGKVEDIFKKNMARFGKKCTLKKGDSCDVLRMPEVTKKKYDIIYIDANHHSRHVLEDAVLAFALLKPEGILIFDDNTDNEEHDNRCPKPAISSFLNAYAGDIRVLHSKWQVIIKRRKTPAKKGACYSEFFPRH